MTSGQRVAGVVLAAGLSSRFGEGDKLLATLEGEPLVVHAVRTLTGADLDAVAVVVDPASGVSGALADAGLAGDDTDADAGANVALVENPDAAAGQATSVRRGVAWARGAADADAVVFALGDMPRVRPETVDCLAAAWRDGRGSALAAAYDGQRGNPVLFDSRHFDALAAVSGDTGGRSVFENAADSAVVETDDPGVRRDVDTRADLGALREDG
ncbi:nucleotidyltransferase family protein [Halobacteriales archaeon QH_1_68_42]|nr:MAG: nucleotidyltransferase family protein [Halobacteriales archaeon QH_1_68_42]